VSLISTVVVRSHEYLLATSMFECWCTTITTPWGGVQELERRGISKVLGSAHFVSVGTLVFGFAIRVSHSKWFQWPLAVACASLSHPIRAIVFILILQAFLRLNIKFKIIRLSSI
jgi:hypothetical protein